MEVQCCVCGLGPTTPANMLIGCDGKNCNVLVHQRCYGILEVPRDEHKWYCKRCEPHSVVRAAKVKCLLCPNREGALKPSLSPTGEPEFAHVVCALALPGVELGSPETLEPVLISTQLRASLGKATCCLCTAQGKGPKEASIGAVLSCTEPSCDKTMHVTCAQRAGLLRVPVRQGQLCQTGSFTVTCRAHQPAAKAKKASSTPLSRSNSTSSAAAPPTPAPARAERRPSGVRSTSASASHGHTPKESSSGAGASRRSQAEERSAAKRAAPAPIASPPTKRRSVSECFGDVFHQDINTFLDKTKRSMSQLLVDDEDEAVQTYELLRTIDRDRAPLERRLETLQREHAKLKDVNTLLSTELPPPPPFDESHPVDIEGDPLTRLKDSLLMMFGIQQSDLTTKDTDRLGNYVRHLSDTIDLAARPKPRSGRARP